MVEKLKCDICSGALVMQEGGTQLICEVCGVKYTTERIREKAATLQKTTGKQSAATTDHTQQYALVSKYYDSGDFSSAERVVKKMLEATPDDPEANRLYDELQVLKHMKIVDGVLVKYSGQAEKLTLPSCVKKIGDKAFASNKNIKHITCNEGLEKIGISAFESCYFLESICFPSTLRVIEMKAFYYTSALKEILCPTGLQEIKYQAFYSSGIENLSVPDTVKNIGKEAFAHCRALSDAHISDHFVTVDVFESSLTRMEFDSYVGPWYKKHPTGIATMEELAREEAERQEEYRKDSLMREEWRARGRCNWCGGRFTRIGFGPRYCSKCGEQKNY